MKSRDDLRKTLERKDKKPYPAYKEIRGAYDYGRYTLSVDHVQGDPFASPSRLSVRIPVEETGFPAEPWTDRGRRLGTCAHLARLFAHKAGSVSGRSGSGKSGLVAMDAPGQEVLETTAVSVRDGVLEARFFVGLPAAGRRILGKSAADLLCRRVPDAVSASLFAENVDPDALTRSARVNEDAIALRAALADLGIVAIVADGAVLPRKSGVDPRPLERGAVAFKSPDALKVEVNLPHANRVTGMGIPRGVTLIVGGGFHGKSTMLSALEKGVYNHCPGDGRELVVTDETAVKIRAEDGRSISSVDISPFIGALPLGSDTRRFKTPNASGSTSQAANILEALEAGCRVLLLDEDTSATNFMIRDRRMQQLISKENEPITPFVDCVQKLWKELEVSTVMVMGGSGDYFDVADTVIAMKSYRPSEVTADARKIAADNPTHRQPETGKRFGALSGRCPIGESLDPRKGKRKEKVQSRGVKTVVFGTEEIDLAAVEQIVHPGQLRAIGEALLELRRNADGRRTLSELLDGIEQAVDRGGLDALSSHPMADLSRFRRFELAAALNRIRTLRVKKL